MKNIVLPVCNFVSSSRMTYFKRMQATCDASIKIYLNNSNKSYFPTKYCFRRCTSSPSSSTLHRSVHNHYSTNCSDDDTDFLDKSLDLENFVNVSEDVFIIQPYLETDKNNLTTPELQLKESAALVECLPSWKVAGQYLSCSKNLKSIEIFPRKVYDTLENMISTNPRISCLFVSVEQLSPLQKKLFTDTCKIEKIYDRYTLVLQIFKLRMKTKQAKLQVALAEIPYMKSSISLAMLMPNSNYQHQGFVSETYHEKLKNEFTLKEQKLRKRLRMLARTRESQRTFRKRSGIPVVAVVGYTNAGKTSLIKALTASDRVKPKDQLFATLDVTNHAAVFPNNLPFVLADTVGFLSNLPHALFDAFSATMEDMLQADVIIHIRDISHPDKRNQLKNVLEILSKLRMESALLQNIVEVRSKIDLLPQHELTALSNIRFPKARKKVIAPGQTDLRPVVTCAVSVTRGDGMAALIAHLQSVVMRVTGRHRFELVIPAAGEHHRWLRKNSAIESVIGEGDYSLKVIAILTEAQLSKFCSAFDDVKVLRKLKEVINI